MRKKMIWNSLYNVIKNMLIRNLFRNPNKPPTKLNLGSGGDYRTDYLNVDAFVTSDVKKDIVDYVKTLKNNCCEEILLKHSLEHIEYDKIESFLKDLNRILKTNGKIIIEVPDLEHTFTSFDDDWKKAQELIYGSQGKYEILHKNGLYHKSGFTEKTLKELLLKYGFKIIEFSRVDDALKVIAKKLD